MTAAFNNIENTALALRPAVEESGVVRLRTSVAASNWLLPVLSDFYAANPDVLLKLEKVILPVASPEFLRQHSIKKIEDLCSVPRLQLANHHSPLMDWRQWLPNQELDKPIPTLVRSYSTYSTLLDAAIYGHGVALGWKYYAAEAPERGELWPVLLLRKTNRLKEFLVVNRQHMSKPHVMRTSEWIRAYAEATRVRFSNL
ncbi:type 2 periplasmic-binding domain-containing protein [Pseudomonas sp. BF-RE-26]|uniref:LysR substrate-binding domain-containing protein n=1 Tax=Pseudomonas sp. BF-RE-26 TaxID=2832396 RepID=UPI001CBDE373|nr:LysR substrate-binding domain-containing protein [Pseudomonas sp. BF-RE-26]